jgi:Voltage gated chloride channel
VAGALIVTLLVTKFAPEARGHGVPEVMDAVYYSEGRIRPMVAAIKSLASSTVTWHREYEHLPPGVALAALTGIELALVLRGG